MPVIDREGTFIGSPVDHGTVRADSGAEQFNIQFEITHFFDFEKEEWEDWSTYQLHAYGSMNLIKKNGDVNEITIRQLQECFAWDGNIKSLAGSWDMPECQIVVKADVYGSKTNYRAKYFNPRDADPMATRGMKKDDPAQASQRLEAHAGAIRAIVGTTKKAAPPPPKPKTATPPPDDEMPPPRDEAGAPF